jgi:predicted Zn-dependent peptidase
MPPTSLQELLPVQEATLNNGLRIRLIPQRDVPTASLYTFFRVGSRNERPGITGISHLFEHMMFNGSARYGPKEFDRVLESNGGQSNAYTSPDATVYYEDFSADALETVLDLEADRMRALQISDASLASEREVVKEERRMRVDNEALGLLDEELQSLVFKAHPYRWPVIGWMGDIEAISRADCEQYFRTFYAPNNAVLYLAGDFEPERALKLISQRYADIPSGPAIPLVPDTEPPQRGERRSQVRYPAQASSMLVGYRAPPGKSQAALALDVLQFALSVGEGCRLTRELVYRQGLAVSAGVDWMWRLDPGLFTFSLELKPSVRPERAEAALDREVNRVRLKGLSADEVQKAKNNLYAHLYRELSTNNGRAHALGSYELFLGQWQAGLELAQAYARVTQRQVKEAAEQYLDVSQRSVVTLVRGEVQR